MELTWKNCQGNSDRVAISLWHFVFAKTRQPKLSLVQPPPLVEDYLGMEVVQVLTFCETALQTLRYHFCLDFFYWEITCKRAKCIKQMRTIKRDWEELTYRYLQGSALSCFKQHMWDTQWGSYYLYLGGVLFIVQTYRLWTVYVWSLLKWIVE